MNENIEGTENNVSKQKKIYVSLVVFMQSGSDRESDLFHYVVTCNYNLRAFG